MKTIIIALGAVERLDRTRLVLSRSFYVIQGKPGEYTRRAGLDRETRKELLLRHIADSAGAGAPFEELSQVCLSASYPSSGSYSLSASYPSSRSHPLSVSYSLAACSIIFFSRLVTQIFDFIIVA